MVMNTNRILSAAALSSIFLFAGAGMAQVPKAAPAASGKSLTVPAALASKGVVYHTITGKDRQVYIESNAPLENIKGQSNRVIGYAVAGGGGGGGGGGSPANLAGGEWRLPVTTIKTGIDLRDEHLASSDWLDAAKFPEVIFTVSKVTDIKVAKESAAFQTYTATLHGSMSLHGVTKEIAVPGATVTFLKESDATRKTAKGDLMALRTKVTVALKDYGVSHPVIGEKVAKDVTIDISLFLSTASPEQQ